MTNRVTGHTIVGQLVLRPGEIDDIHDIEVGMGVDLVNGLCFLVFDRYTRALTFDEYQLRDWIQKLERQADTLKLGKQPGH